MRLALLSILIITLAAGSLSAQELTGTLHQIDKSGKIKIGYRELLPPLSFETKDGQPVGYSIDLCSEIVSEVEKNIGRDITVEYVPVLAADRFAALAGGKIDILCGASTKTISRSKIVDFTQLTFATGATFMALEKTKIKNNFDGKKIGVTEGSTTTEALRKLLEETAVKAEIVPMKSSKEAFNALNKGKIDAFASDQVVLIGLAFISGHPESYTVFSDLFTYEPLALAVRKNDSDFRLVADSVISNLCRTGEIFNIYDKWFGQFAKQRSAAFDALIQINKIPE
ncbi:MAG: hypothetical protein BA863_00425 [Desulfovibrio sp. S3730MH75]|nr:MAG: hypothetical protein BA863_00425 [Desulfovibrio sp. S3730MH75]